MIFLSWDSYGFLCIHASMHLSQEASSLGPACSFQFGSRPSNRRNFRVGVGGPRDQQPRGEVPWVRMQLTLTIFTMIPQMDCLLVIPCYSP